MAKFVIHKKGFFYTDEAFEPAEEARGSIVASFDTLEKATAAKLAEDISSIQGLKGMNVVDFFFYSKTYDAIYKQLEALYKQEYGESIKDKYYFNFPKNISSEQAKRFLDILGVSFHDIVEYPDNEVLNPEDFNLEERELGEF